MKLQSIFYFIVSSIGIGAAFGVALDDMAVGAAYGIGVLPSMLKKQSANCIAQEKK